MHGQQNVKTLFYSLKGTFLRINFVMYLTKGNHLLDRINNIITHAVDAGLVDQWWREMKLSWTLRRDTQIPALVNSTSYTLQVCCARQYARVKTERDGTRAETRFGLPAKRTSPFISAGVSVQSSTGFLGVRVGGERL